MHIWINNSLLRFPVLDYIREMVASGVLFEVFPRSYNKLNSYNLTKNNLRNTEAHLRDLYIESPEVGQGNAEIWATGCSGGR